MWPFWKKNDRDKKDAKQFAKDYKELMGRITVSLKAVDTVMEAAPQLEMLEGLASYGMPQAVTFLGLALLMDDKPWYDPVKGLETMKRAAEMDDAQSAFSKLELGRVYLIGRKDIPVDPVSGRYWVEQSAALGYLPALEEIQSRWD